MWTVLEILFATPLNRFVCVVSLVYFILLYPSQWEIKKKKKSSNVARALS